MTGDEKWIHYDNLRSIEDHASTSAKKPNMQGSKLLLSNWLDQLDVVYNELLKPTKTIKGNSYELQLMCLSRALKKKWSLYEQRHDKVIL